jgi:hypothetical protein
MTYFKTGLGLTTAELYGGSKVSSDSLARASGTTVDPSQATGIVAMEQIKANWPKKTMTVQAKRDGVPVGEPTTTTVYIWKFADGTTQYTQAWSNEYYLHVKAGTSPTPKYNIPDLSNVALGSRQYFWYLCKAQGPYTATAQGVRIAFDKKGWKWNYPTTFSSAPKTIPNDQLDICRAGLERLQTKTEDSWVYGANQYARLKVDSFIEARKSATLRDHRASECKNRVPPEQVAACEAFVGAPRGQGGGTIESFIDKVASGEMSQEEFDAWNTAGGGASGSLLGGIPIEYLAAGGVGVVLLGALLLKRRK